MTPQQESSDFFFEVGRLSPPEEYLEWKDFESKRSRYRDEHSLLRATGEIEDCACQHIPDLLADHVGCSLLTSWLRCRDWREEALQAIAEMRGWSTLEGPHGRRQALQEELPEAPFGRGAPRTVFFGVRHAGKARDLVDHAYASTNKHLHRTLTAYAVAELRTDEERDCAAWIPFSEATISGRLLSVLDEATQLSAGRYEYRRERIADQLLAEIAGSTVRGIRSARSREENPQIELWASAVSKVQNLVAAVVREYLRHNAPDLFEQEEDRKELILKVAKVQYGTVKAQKKWLRDKLDVLRGELKQEYVRPRMEQNDLSEVEAVQEVTDEAVTLLLRSVRESGIDLSEGEVQTFLKNNG